MKFILPFLLVLSLTQSLPITDYENHTVVKFLKNDPLLYSSLAEEISKVKGLQKFLNNDHIDFNGLLNDENSHQIVINFLNKNLHHITKRQINFNNFLGSFLNVLDSFGQSIQSSLQSSFQQLVSTTITDIINRIQSSIFAGQPANFNDIVSVFLKNLKNILTNNVVNSVSDTFKQQALSTLELQFKELNKLLDDLKNGSVAPVQFISFLQKALGNLQNRLSQFVPNIADLITNQLLTLLDQILKAKLN
ncbi:unnamed protein product [Brachionus calyciflorus]|uniref:Uncharacterized protein n=1 Tax=Brachionus calyciflorus TaxID=104777 RepID=A0A813M3S8_9BILA|nr:unnamed protein product [Brachionus calyciflorus]